MPLLQTELLATLADRAIVIVANNKISVVGDANSVRIPSGVKVIDLGNVTLLPGFIDAHTHLVGRVLGDPEGDMAANNSLALQDITAA